MVNIKRRVWVLGSKRLINRKILKKCTVHFIKRYFSCVKKALLILTAILSLSFASHGKTVTLISMDIPPFMSPSLPHDGAAVYALRKMFKRIGYDVKIRFVPIQRTRNVGMSDPEINGFFPSFVDDDFVHGMTLSKTFYRTPWVIAERKKSPIKWRSSKDLLRYRGGNVGGYTLRSQIAAAYEGKENLLEAATADKQNLLKLANKRVDFIFIDENVFKFFISLDPDVKKYAKALQINPKIVALNEYGVAFKNTGDSLKIMEEFNKIANEEEYTREILSYINQYAKPPEAGKSVVDAK